MVFALALFLSGVSGQSNCSLYDIRDSYYAKTNFKSVDTINRWVFSINSSFKGFPDDSIKPIGKITFSRKVPMPVSKSKETNKKYGSFFLDFEIFNLKDSSFCRKESNRTRFVSSCVPPYVGGDILFTGDFILLSRNVCIPGIGYELVDYTRPIINKVFCNTNLSTIHSLQNFIDNLPIQGKLY